MATYRRLMGYLRPYRVQLWGSLVFAWAAMGMTVLIPWLVGQAVNAIRAHEKPDLPPLALIALIPAPFVVYTASRYNRVSRPALQEVQQRIAELTAEAEENVSGIRIVKAFAREEHQLHRFQRAVARVFDQSIYSTRLA